MQDAAARNLRTAERFLLSPPLPAVFGVSPIKVCDISAKGARFRHDRAVETGTKDVLRLAPDGNARPVTVEAIVVWSHADTTGAGGFVSGVRTFGQPEVMDSVIGALNQAKRINRIEELRTADRFFINPALGGTFDGRLALIEDLSVRGARVEVPFEPLRGSQARFAFSLPKIATEFEAVAEVVWSSLKSIDDAENRMWRAGLRMNEKSDLLRLAIGHLCDEQRAVIDTNSLRLKLKIIRARARELAPGCRAHETSGVLPEQYLLIQGVREELRLNPEEALHWYRRARLIIRDPGTRGMAGAIADHPDAIAVWEYLDRSLDPSIVARVFDLPR